MNTSEQNLKRIQKLPLKKRKLELSRLTSIFDVSNPEHKKFLLNFRTELREMRKELNRIPD